MNAVDQKTITKVARRYLIRSMIAPVFMGFLYFLSAGNLANTRAWSYYILFFALSLGISIVLFIKNRELLYHRASFKSDAVGWDKWLMPMAVMTGFHVQSIVMGLEARFAEPFINDTALIVGFILYLVSYVISSWAMLVNRHFETNVRIQKDRNHKVITTGPYSVIRHPGYLAFILATFGIPLIIGSHWGFINATVGTVLILIRTYKEDQTLQCELDGYKTYTQSVKWRIFPGAW